MPPPLALILCIGFVIFLLRLDRRLSPDAAPALWISTIWLVYTSSKPLAFWFGYSGLDSDAGSPLDRSFQIILLLLAIRLLARRKADWISVMKENVWLSILIVFMFISILWSPVMFVSLKRWSGEILAVVLGLLISTEDDPRKAIQCILRRIVYILIPFSVLLIKYFPQYGLAHHHWSGVQMWIGVTQQKNALGILAAISAFFLFWCLMRRWRQIDIRGPRYQPFVDLFIISLSFWLLRGPGTYSATSVLMLIVGLIFYVWFMAWKKRPEISTGIILPLIMIFLIIYGTATPFIGTLPFGDISSELGRDSTLTGRSEIWAALVPFAKSKPFFGHGLGGFWTSAARARFVFFPAHNAYLEIILALGFVGLLIFSLFIIASCRKAQEELSLRYDWGVLWICWLIMALLESTTEAYFHTFTSLLMAGPLWLAITLKRNKHMKTSHSNEVLE